MKLEVSVINVLEGTHAAEIELSGCATTKIERCLSVWILLALHKIIRILVTYSVELNSSDLFVL